MIRLILILGIIITPFAFASIVDVSPNVSLQFTVERDISSLRKSQRTCLDNHGTFNIKSVPSGWKVRCTLRDKE